MLVSRKLVENRGFLEIIKSSIIQVFFSELIDDCSGGWMIMFAAGNIGKNFCVDRLSRLITLVRESPLTSNSEFNANFTFTV